MKETEKERFRDSIGTISESGQRKYIYPKKIKGKYHNYRTYLSWFLLTFLFIAPFIRVKGNQLLLFDIFNRKFNVFGYPFWPQDFYLLVISMLVGIVFIIVFTVVYGRIFCGWICPQTIFMEMVFRKIEYWIEGDRTKQIKLAKQNWDTEKLSKKIAKWTIFFLISFLIANIFLSYFIGSETVLGYIKEGPSAHISTLIRLLIFTSIFYFVFSWFREQVCIIVCPYGRLQGVLLDNKSINVAYDFMRGEGKKGRKPLRKGENRAETKNGDCIDCKQCVQVCPTGIDIRNGTQLECINCTACIDACDNIMDSVGFDRGLIRYASEDEIEKGEKFKFNTRLIAYSALLIILISTLIAMLFLRSDVEATVLRLPGQNFQTTANSVKNVYTVKLINKTTKDFNNVEIKLISHKGNVQVVGGDLTLKKQDLTEGTLFIDIDKSDLKYSSEKITLGVYSNGKLIDKTNTNFTGPLIIN